MVPPHSGVKSGLLLDNPGLPPVIQEHHTCTCVFGVGGEGVLLGCTKFHLLVCSFSAVLVRLPYGIFTQGLVVSSATTPHLEVDLGHHPLCNFL